MYSSGGHGGQAAGAMRAWGYWWGSLFFCRLVSVYIPP